MNMLHHTLSANDLQTVDLVLPLHPTTDNAEHVAQLLDGLLGLVDEFCRRRQASEADALQALTAATALRAAMAEISRRGDGPIPARLLEIEVQDDHRPTT
jgi:hypothetical protein